MPVVFQCHNCRSRLKVGRKKIGSEVECPRCRVALTVPSDEEAGLPTALPEAPKLPDDAFPEFAVFDDPLPPPPPVLRPAPTAGGAGKVNAEPPRSRAADRPGQREPPQKLAIEPPRPGPTAPGPGSDKPSQRTRAGGSGNALGFLKRDDQPSSYQDALLIRRRTLYVQAALIVLMAFVGLALGYLIGRGIGPADRGPGSGDSHVELAGTLTFRDGRGEELPDSGAVVIALPQDMPPGKLLAAAGLGPQMPRDPGRVAELAIEELGGKYDRTDALGNFTLRLPKPGSYRLLFISRGARRPAGEVVTAGQLREMQRYFAAPADLIGGNKYVWALREVRDPRLAVLHTF